MTEAMPFLQKAILLSYDPRPFGLGIFLWWTVQGSNSTATPQAGQSKPQWGFD